MFSFICGFLALGLFSANTISSSAQILGKDDIKETKIVTKKASSQNNENYNLEDQYENNNCFSEATNLSPINYYLKDTFSTEITASLDTISGICDIDYYYFDLLTDSTVVATVSTASSFSFNMYIYNTKYLERAPEDNEAFRTNVNIYSNESTKEKSKTFSNLLTPGCYYLCLTCQQARNSGIGIKYSVNLKGQKSQENYSNESLADLRINKGFGMAAWISDYIPINKANAFDMETNETYYDYSKEGISIPDHSLDDLLEITPNKDISMAIFYIWDDTLLSAINNLTQYISQELINNFSETEKTKVIVTTIVDKSKKTIALTFEIVNAIGEIENFVFSFPAKIAFSLFEKGIDIALDLISKFLVPNIPLEKYLYFAMIQKLNGLTQNLSSYPAKYLRIPFIYSLSKSSSISSPYERHKISFTDTVNSFLSTNNNLITNDMNNDLILSDRTDSYYCRGKIYGFENDSSNKGGWKLACQETDKTPIYSNLSLEYAVSLPQLDYLDYAWFRFVAPQDDEYCFFTSNDPSKANKCTTIDVFSKIENGYSDLNKKVSRIGGFYNNDGIELGAYYEKKLIKNEILFFRIHGESYEPIPSSQSVNAKIGFKINMKHTHYYDDHYSWSSSKKHFAFCSCGQKTSQPHIVAGNSFSGGTRYGKCLLCGGICSFGPVVHSSKKMAKTESCFYGSNPNSISYPKETFIDYEVLNLNYEDTVRCKNDSNYIYVLLNRFGLEGK